MTFTMAVSLLGGLGLFLFGMSVMSEGLQAVAGERLRSFLRALTSNRVAGVMTGFTVTSIVQSSSATTVMLVGFVGAGLLDLSQAVGVVMGANIGTTVTGWLVALLGFKVKIAALALPAIGVGFFARFTGKEVARTWGDVLVGFGLLFLGLDFMKDSVGDLKGSAAIAEWATWVQVDHLGTYLLMVGVGAVITMVIQSSSATMAVTMTVAQQGLIDFPTAAALIMGENIGTTITANLAAMGSTPAAKQTARVHLLFNLAGVAWMSAVFFGFVRLVDVVAPGEALSEDPVLRAAAIPAAMAAFHTGFNVMNTLIFLPFGRLFERAARWMVPDASEDKRVALRLVCSDLVDTPELAVDEARQALRHMGRLALEGLEGIATLVDAPKGADPSRGLERVKELEAELDQIEEEITRFTIALSRQRLTEELSRELNRISGTAHDFERIGDHLQSLVRALKVRHRRELDFSAEEVEDLH
ncbi:MAG: Na/Pi cotransporter family protein [Deltaproteobacteria bacterium]|nr:Na/Pi cotransporter family protein [Deltaproteobacteria bacterium]